MPQRTRTSREEGPEGIFVLLKDFPLTLHREMKAAAVRRGIHVAAAYGEACREFLRAQEQKERRKRGG